MRRPLVWFSAVFLASLVLSLLAEGLSGLMAACAVLLFCALLPGPFSARRGMLCAGVLACLAALGVAWMYHARLSDWGSLAGREADFTGWVREENPYLPGRGTVEGTLTLEDGARSRTVLLDIRGLGDDLAPGSWVAGRLLVYEARQDGDALGGVSLFCIATGEVSEIPAPAEPHPLAAMAATRWALSQRAWEVSPGEPAAVVLAMVFSRQDLLPQAVLEQMDRAGMRHLLVVSGLHLSMAVGWILAACRQLRLGRRAGSLAALAAVWLLAGLAGFSIPVVRAAVMSSLWLAGRCVGRRGDSLTALAVAALLSAAVSPPVVFQAGWQLTFAATLGVLLGSEPMAQGMATRWRSRFGSPGRLAQWVMESLSTSLCAQLGALPVLAAVFGRFSVWGLVTTLLAMPLVAGIIPLGGSGCALLSWNRTAAAGRLVFGLARRMGRCFLALAALVCRLPGGVVPVLLPYQLFLCLLAPLAVFGYLLFRPWLVPRRARMFRRGTVLAAVLILLYSTGYYHGAVVVSANGSTGSVVVATPDGTVVLAGGEDNYGRRVLSSQLLRCGAEGPLVLVCPWDSSLNGILWWTQALSPTAVVVPGEEIGLLQSQLPGNYRPLTAGPAEVLPGVLVSHPVPEIACVEVRGKKLLKSWAGYDIIADVPLEGDLLIDMDGRMFPLSPGLRPGRMPTGETNLLLPAWF